MNGIGPSGDAEALLAHAGWVRSLARSLVIDPQRADDAMQQAWLAVLEKPPRHAENLRAWLRRIVRSSVREIGRGEARRARREVEAAIPELLPSTAQVVEHAELQRGIVGAVLELDEPTREAILLRFWWDLTPAQIAERQGVPAGTVRSRIHLALAQLRERLDGEFDGNRQAWVALLVSGVRAEQVAKTVGATGTAAVITGAVAMSTQIKLAVVVALVGIAGWMAWGGGAALFAPEGSGDSRGVAGLDLRPAGIPGDGGAANFEEDGRGSRRMLAGAVLAPLVYGTVLDDDLAPLSGATVTVYPDVPQWETTTPIAQTRSDDNGYFRIERSGPDLAELPAELVVQAALDGYLTRFQINVTPGGDGSLKILRLIDMHGCVRDADTGEGIAGAEIHVSDRVAVTDNDGIYVMPEAVTRGSLRMNARKPGYVEEEYTREWFNCDPVIVDFDLLSGRLLTGRVFDRETGEPIAGAEVYRDNAFQGAPVAASNADGEFAITLAVGGEFHFVITAPHYCGLEWEGSAPYRDLDSAPRFPLVAPALVRGMITDDAGKPVSKARVFVRGAGHGGGAGIPPEDHEALGLFGRVAYQLPLWSRLQLDEEGIFQLPVVPRSVPLAVHAVVPGCLEAISDPVSIAFPQDRPWVELVAERVAGVRGQAVFNGEPFFGEVCWRKVDGERGGSMQTEWKTGRFDFERVPAGTVVLFPRSSRITDPDSVPEVTVELAKGETREQDLVWEEARIAIRGRVTSSDGEPCSEAYVYATITGREGSPQFSGGKTALDGTYSIPVPLTGTFDVVARREPVRRERSGIEPGATEVDLVLPRTGWLDLRLVDEETGSPIELRSRNPGSISWREPGARRFREIPASRFLTGRGDVEFPTGTVDLRVWLGREGYAPRFLSQVPVPEGTNPYPLTIELSRGVEAGIVLLAEDESEWETTPEHVLFLLEETQVDLVDGPFFDSPSSSVAYVGSVPLRFNDRGITQQYLRPDATGHVRLQAVRPGIYTIRAFPDDYDFTPEWFEITREAEVPIGIRWRRR